MTTPDSQDNFNYQLLTRLQMDCEYYLGWGHRAKKHLWAGDEAAQIQKMKELYAGFAEKPAWITFKDIEQYEAKMVRSNDGTADRHVTEILQHRVSWFLFDPDAPTELDESSIAQITALIQDGNTQGELFAVDADGFKDYCGCWSIETA